MRRDDHGEHAKKRGSVAEIADVEAANADATRSNS